MRNRHLNKRNKMKIYHQEDDYFHASSDQYTVSVLRDIDAGLFSVSIFCNGAQFSYRIAKEDAEALRFMLEQALKLKANE